MSHPLIDALRTLEEANRCVAEEMKCEFPVGVVVSFRCGRGFATGVVTYHPHTWSNRPDHIGVRHASGRIKWVIPLEIKGLGNVD